MRAARFGIIIFCCFVVVASIGSFTTAQAQNGTCSALAKTALDAVKQACGTATANSICFGYQAVKVALTSAASGDSKAGDHVNLADVKSVTTSAANPDSTSWGVAVLSAQVGLPESKPGVTA